MRLLITLILISLFVLSASYSQEEFVKFERLSIEDGLSQNIIYCIYQDKQGFMWFGTQDGGLNQYDGYNITVYTHDPSDPFSISSNNVNQVCGDSLGQLWIGTWGGGLNRFDPATRRFYHYQHSPENPKSLSDNTIQVVFIDSQGTIWIGTNGGGLNKFIREDNTFIHYKNDTSDINSLSHNRIWSISEDQSDNLWIGTNEGLNMFNPATQKFTRFMHDPDNASGISDNQVRTTYVDNSGNIWIGTGKGLDLYDPDKGTFAHFIIYPEDTQTPQMNKVNAILEADNGTFWVGTQLGGLNRLKDDGTFWHLLNNPYNPNSLSHNDIRVIYQDRSGILWAATRGGGLNKLDLNPVKFLHFKNDPVNPNSLSNNRVKAIIEDKNSMLWIGTDHGGLNKYDIVKRKFTHYKKNETDPNSLNSNRIITLLEDGNGIIWIGTDDGGLNRFDPEKEKFTHYKNDPEDLTTICDNEVSALYEDYKGRLWAGTKAGLNLFHPEQGNFTRYVYDPDNDNSLSNNRIYVIHEDLSGNFWIGTDNGLNRFEAPQVEKNGNIKFTRYFNDPADTNSLSNNDVFSICEDSRGNLWIGTGMGLSKYNRETDSFISYTKKHGLKSGTIYGLLEDNLGMIWLSTINGLSQFNPVTGEFRNYDVRDGLQSNEFSRGAAYCKTRAGQLMFGGINGFNVVFPDNVKDNTTKPNIVITGFSISIKEVGILPDEQALSGNNIITDGNDYYLPRHISYMDKVILSYRESVFSFDFAALHYVNPGKNMYSYMLEGFDKDWNYIENRRSANYTNLDHGEYTLKIAGTNCDGIWCEEPVSLKIIITPPFWKTWWFRTLVIIIILTSAYLWYRSRIRRVEAQKRILEIQVKERTAEIEQQKEEILDKNEELQQQKEEIATQRDFVMKQSDKIALQNQKIKQQRDFVIKQKEEITSSIEYAKRIQNVILPPQEFIEKNFPEHFLLFMPRDIVSGDFYWITEKNGKVVFAAADCTGHGVPGAFMSILGITFLNEIINIGDNIQANEILEILRKDIIESLRQTGRTGEQKDGMDIALCIFDLESKMLQFAGANNPLYLMRKYSGSGEQDTAQSGAVNSSQKTLVHGNYELIEYKANKMPIGIHHSAELEPFTSHDIQMESGDSLYIFSDGYADQFGGPDGKKFKYKPFKILLLEHQDKAMEEQKDILDKKFAEWKGELEQVDDIVVIGVKVP